MGTLGNQPARNPHQQDVKWWVKELAGIAKETGVPLDQVIEAAKVAEMHRANNIAVSDGDYRDEHAGGYGDLLRELITVLEGEQ